jgi:hypothetical protein
MASHNSDVLFQQCSGYNASKCLTSFKSMTCDFVEEHFNYYTTWLDDFLWKKLYLQR